MPTSALWPMNLQTDCLGSSSRRRLSANTKAGMLAAPAKPRAYKAAARQPTTVASAEQNSPANISHAPQKIPQNAFGLSAIPSNPGSHDGRHG